MKIDAREDMIHKNGNLLDQTVGLPLKRKPLYKELILNNNSVIVNNNVVKDEHCVDGNDDLNNNDFDRDESKYYKCPVCKSEDFTTADFLDEHVKTQHPNFKPSCKDCGEVFPSLKSLASHSIMHVTENSAIRHNPINLKILSFLDTKKSFYHQPNENRDTSQSYRCNFCGEHFVGAQFMNHWQQCKRFIAEESASSKFSKDDSETEEVKSSFLAGLNLHGRSESHTSSDTDSNRSLKSEKTEDELTKPASSQLMSVIQNTTAYPKHPIFFVPEEGKNFQDDDDDDPFKLEVRDMKRRGEFPCRICQKIFRNLRALKGHARIHITCNKGARPYECNICTYSTNDKSMVIRHIRNHNGDHPYKCQLCCSTFTTKANCERHLRNAHRKTSREDIKKLLVDLNNKPQNSVANFKNKLQSLLTTGLVKNEEGDEIRAAPKFLAGEFYKMKNDNDENEKSITSNSQSEAANDQRSDADESSNSNDSNNNSNTVLSTKKVENYQLISMPMQKYSDFHIAGLLDMRTASRPEKQFYEANYKSYNDVMIGTGLVPTIIRDNGLIKVSSYNSHYHKPESDAEEPLDLSVDVLDLSKKKNTSSAADESGAEDLSLRARDHERTSSPLHRTVPSQPMFFGKNDATYSFPTNTIMPSLSPFFVPNTNLNAFPSASIDTDEDMHGAKIRPLMFGPIVTSVDHYEDIRQNVPSFVEQPKEHDNKVDSKYKEAAAKPRPGKSSTVKMVMKDGVLVEKQKQRRYRTEKPFSCAYCSGRFTLRSNMDRHVKQQHPGFWRQRQRGGSTRSPRTKSKEESHDTVSVKSESHLSQSESVQDFDMVAAEKRSHDSSDVEVDDDSEYRLAKKNKTDLPGDNIEEDDEDEEELVIDEEVKDAETTEEKFEILSNTSGEKVATKEENPDLASVRSLLDNVSTQTFSQYFRNDEDPNMKQDDGSEEDEEGLVAGSSSEGNGSGGEENRPATEPGVKNNDKNPDGTKKKKSAYSSAPNRVHCDFCYRSFPWASSLRRHTLTHTGQKPYKCSNCPLLFTTKSNCDRHFLRKHRSQLNEMPSAATANVMTTIDGDRATSSRLIPNFSTRNVPERPFKCNHCPSSTFSTFQNLKKHIVEKHNQSEDKVEDMAYAAEFPKHKKEETSTTTISEAEFTDKSCAEEKDGKPPSIGPTYDQNFGGHASSDLPFKCHLCDRSFAERQEALDHMGESHALEFQHLMSKGALDMSVKLEDTMNHDESGFAGNSDENSAEPNRGRFPDYSSRKVICAFCLRRFWSAEDLRRHMRTHTGERPFACDICQRRFTLKHSMLRHRKKHSSKSFTSTSGENSPNTDDEEPSSPYSDNREVRVVPLAIEKSESPPTIAIKLSEFEPSTESSAEQEKGSSLPTEKDVTKTCNKTTKEDGVDLIAKLLDIDDKELVDEMLSSKSADDVAKLLGVQK